MTAKTHWPSTRPAGLPLAVIPLAKPGDNPQLLPLLDENQVAADMSSQQRDRYGGLTHSSQPTNLLKVRTAHGPRLIDKLAAAAWELRLSRVRLGQDGSICEYRSSQPVAR